MKKKGKRLGAMAMAAMTVFLQCSNVQAAGDVYQEESAGTATIEEKSGGYIVEDSYVNPLYEGTIQKSDLNKLPDDINSGISTYSEIEYADTVKEAGEQIREGMKQREEVIQVYYQAPEYVDGIMREIAQEALIHTGEPTEGDYLRWQYGGWNAEGRIEQSAEDNMCYMTFTYTYTYYTTYEQETIVDERISEVLDQLDVYDGSAYDKIHAVYDFICQNTVYDYDNLNDDDYKLKYTAYAALIDGKSVCQGYALLVYRMALELGVDSRVISGTGNGGAHGWNIVEINNLYYNADTTWDAGNSEYEYFLKADKNFTDHVRDGEYTSDEFYAEYPMAEEDYDPSDAPSDIVVDAPEITSVYSQVQTWAKVTWTAVEGAEGYELYRAETPDAPDGTWKLTKTILDGNTVQYTNTGLTPGQTYYYKVRAFYSNGDGAKTYTEFSNVNYMPATVIFNGPYSNSVSGIRILWNQVQGAHGYQIWRQNEDGSFSIVKTIGDKGNTLTDDQGSTIAYSNTGLETGETYTYKMRAFAILNGNKVFGTYSDEVTVAVMPEKPDLTVNSNASARAVITWSQVNGAAGYQIWRAESENGSYSIAKSITDGDTISYTNTGLTSGKTYYYKVRAYTELDGKKTFGEYSDTKTVTVK